MSERLNELYILTQKAQKMEMINEELALQMYLDIFANYTPKFSKTFESTIRLLEKRQRYEEALTICLQAIELLKADEISGVIGRFEDIKTRLERKMQENGFSAEPPKKKKAFSIKYLAFILILIVVIFAIFSLASPYDDINVNLEGKESLSGGDAVFSETTESPQVEYPITSEMIDVATKTLLRNHDAVDANILPQDETLGVAVIVAPGTDASRAKELATLYMEALGGVASATYSDLSGPSDSSLGEIYDYYDLVISVGTGTAEEDILAKGTKSPTQSEIYWRNDGE